MNRRHRARGVSRGPAEAQLVVLVRVVLPAALTRRGGEPSRPEKIRPRRVAGKPNAGVARQSTRRVGVAELHRRGIGAAALVR